MIGLWILKYNDYVFLVHREQKNDPYYLSPITIELNESYVLYKNLVHEIRNNWLAFSGYKVTDRFIFIFFGKTNSPLPISKNWFTSEEQQKNVIDLLKKKTEQYKQSKQVK
jgi:hypothetical protein